MLGKQFDDLLPKLLVARLIGKDGKPSDSPQPEVRVLADGRAECTWYVEIYFDKRAFYDKVVPKMDQVLSSVASKSGGPMVSESVVYDSGKPEGHRNIFQIGKTKAPVFQHRYWKGTPVEKPTADSPYVYFFLSTGCSENGATERFLWYLLEGHQYQPALVEARKRNEHTTLSVEFLGADNGVVWSDGFNPWNSQWTSFKKSYERKPSEGVGGRFQPYYLRCSISGFTYAPNPVKRGKLICLSPRFGHGQSDREINCGYGHSDTVVKAVTATLDPADLERIKQVRFHFSNKKAPR